MCSFAIRKQNNPYLNMSTKITIGVYYIANIFANEANPKQPLAQGYHLNFDNGNTWEDFGPMPIGSLWNKFSQGPKSDFNSSLLIGKILLVQHLEDWTDEYSKRRFAVLWQAYNLNDTPFEEDMCIIADEMIGANTPDYELLEDELDEETVIEEDEFKSDLDAEEGGFTNGK